MSKEDWFDEYTEEEARGRQWLAARTRETFNRWLAEDKAGVCGMELRMYGYRCEVQVLFGVLAVILIVFIGIANKILQ